MKIIFLVLFFLQASPCLAKPNLLLQRLSQIQQQTTVGAVAYALVENDKIISTGGLGHYGLDDNRQVTADSLFRIGSITKTFTALAVMRLVEHGVIKLDDSVKKYIPHTPLNSPFGNPATIEMMLEHTAGLQDLTGEEFSYPAPLSLEQAFLLTPKARHLRWPPGYHFSYSNAGAGYVARVIERVTKQNYDDWFEREVLTKLGMSNSRIRWSKELEESLVAGYDSDLKTQIPYWHTLFRAFGGLNTTATDMANFLLLFTDEANSRAKIVSHNSIVRMETPTTSLAARAGLLSGYGLGIRNEIYQGHRIYRHGGDGDGYLAKFAYSKETHRGYFIVINAFRHDLLERFASPLNDWLIESLDKPEFAAVKQIAKKELKKILGDYRQVTERFPMTRRGVPELLRLRLIDGELYRCFPATDKCARMLLVADSLFRTPWDYQASMAVVKADDGIFYFQSEFGNYRKIEP